MRNAGLDEAQAGIKIAGNISFRNPGLAHSKSFYIAGHLDNNNMSIFLLMFQQEGRVEYIALPKVF